MRKYTCLKIFAICVGLSALAVGVFTTCAQAEKPVHVEILFMNHGPMQPTIRNLKALLQKHAGAVQAQWFDFDKSSGKSFMKRKGIQGHIPLLIFVNGNHTFNMGGRQVTFMGFPSGAGPYQFQGKWGIQDLENVIVSLSRGKLN